MGSAKHLEYCQDKREIYSRNEKVLMDKNLSKREKVTIQRESIERKYREKVAIITSKIYVMQ